MKQDVKKKNMDASAKAAVRPSQSSSGKKKGGTAAPMMMSAAEQAGPINPNKSGGAS